MGPKKPEIEYIHLRRIFELRKAKDPPQEYTEAYECLRKLAQGAMKKGPFTVTNGKTAPHIAASGDPRDFLSYAPYWWPEEKNGKVNYVRRDGKRNPDCKLVQDQSQLEGLAENLTYLCLGYYLLGKPEYGNHAVSLIDAFFVNDKTKMNPHVEYGQVVRGANNPTGKGRAEGIISTRFLARVVNVLPLLQDHEAYTAVSQPVRAWFSDYLRWLLESSIGKKEAATKNNHYTFYLVQTTSIQQFLQPENRDGVRSIENYFNVTLPKQVDPNTGNQPLEANRTKPFHYLEFNLHAALFLGELAIDAGCNVYSHHQLIPLATTYMVGCCKPDMKEDMTEGVRTVEIVKSRYGDTNDSCYTNFLENARRCKDAENLSGPKHAIARLWFYHENGQQCSPSTSSSSSSSSSSNGSHHHKGSRTKAFLNKLLHRNK
ncbi:putative alginate lyase [Zychaea mexicana]|uniref:putative alginate lyase n=1 Tax=Zychaea mexicana TaxID=64656 RepID=UPI0022FDF383|nr:putative alginate lyase [Zychaea mexicana]KAI9489869.1 putative alginate lyase [Zychaea mexicana]